MTGRSAAARPTLENLSAAACRSTSTADSPAIQTLINTYNDVTGEGKKPFTMGGGTYARHFPYAVSFGPEHTDIADPVLCGPDARRERGHHRLRSWSRR